MALPDVACTPAHARPLHDASGVVDRAWTEVLGPGALDRGRTFEEAGGDSLQLMHLVFLLERASGRRLPPGIIHGGQRPDEMAVLLDGPAPDADPARSGLPPLFLLPGMGGDDPQLARLGPACAGLARVVHLSYPPWTSMAREAGFDLDALVAGVVGQIASQCPPGPVLLAGYSFGGIVAFAAAASLARAGYAVRFLVLLDSETVPIDRGVAAPPSRGAGELRDLLAALRRRAGGEALARIVFRRLISPRWRPVLRLAARIPQAWLPREFAACLARYLLFWHLRPLARRWIALADTLPKLDTHAVLLRTDDHDAEAGADLGWERLCPKLRVIRVPGTHLGLFERSNLPAICDAFARVVAQAVGADPPAAAAADA